MPKFIAGLIVSLALAVPAFALETFIDEAKAQQHCPKDIVVWLNLPTMIWHYKGQRWWACSSELRKADWPVAEQDAKRRGAPLGRRRPARAGARTAGPDEELPISGQT
jgi:hypothetical protein